MRTFKGTVTSGTGTATRGMKEVTPDEWTAAGIPPPYPGTLNIFVGKPARETLLRIAENEGFDGPNKNRNPKFLKVTLKTKHGFTTCYAKFSRDKTTIELVSELNLRNEYGLKNQTPVEITL